MDAHTQTLYPEELHPASSMVDERHWFTVYLTYTHTQSKVQHTLEKNYKTELNFASTLFLVSAFAFNIFIGNNV